MSLTGTTLPPLSTGGKVIDDAPPVSPSPKGERLDIEHVFVEDDPRNWSKRYKVLGWSPRRLFGSVWLTQETSLIF
jgi:hypothetical protein